jgi:hypothetical protein
MNAVNKALSDQKSSGRRMVIEEVDGSDSEDVEAKLNKKNAEKSEAGNASSSASNHSSVGVKTGDSKNETSGQQTPAGVGADSSRDTAVNSSRSQTVETVHCSGDGNASTESSKHPCPAESKPDVASGDGGSQTTVLPSEPLPAAVQVLKDEGNDLFRKGQYGDAIDKYSAAIQILSGYFFRP